MSQWPENIHHIDQSLQELLERHLGKSWLRAPACLTCEAVTRGVLSSLPWFTAHTQELHILFFSHSDTRCHFVLVSGAQHSS